VVMEVVAELSNNSAAAAFGSEDHLGTFEID
jgi:hypothetical protein